MWTWLVSDRRVGSIKIVSPNTQESYEITQWGSWVPTVDVEKLLQLERDVCCTQGGGLVRVRILACGNPTTDQMKIHPKRTPRAKSKPGLPRTRRRRRK